jgi:hypothetical protein
MVHRCYFEINAASYFDLGLKRGELFGDIAQKTLARAKDQVDWVKKVDASKKISGGNKEVFLRFSQGVGGVWKGL